MVFTIRSFARSRLVGMCERVWEPDAESSVGHVQVRGSDFFEIACARPRGNRGEARQRSYHADGTSTNWCKMKNPAYTQMTARHELFDRRTGSRRRGLMLRVHKNP
jgi:hypothetical protein